MHVKKARHIELFCYQSKSKTTSCFMIDQDNQGESDACRLNIFAYIIVASSRLCGKQSCRMSTTVCTAKATCKKSPGLLELTDTHLQWTQDGKKAPSIRVSYAEASCQWSFHGFIVNMSGSPLPHSTFLQQRRSCTGQAEAWSCW